MNETKRDECTGSESATDGENNRPARGIGDTWAEYLTDSEPCGRTRREQPECCRTLLDCVEAPDQRRRRDPDRTDRHAGDHPSPDQQPEQTVSGGGPACGGGHDDNNAANGDDDVVPDAVDDDADAEVRARPGDQDGADEPDGSRLCDTETGRSARQDARRHDDVDVDGRREKPRADEVRRTALGSGSVVGH